MHSQVRWLDLSEKKPTHSQLFNILYQTTAQVLSSLYRAMKEDKFTENKRELTAKLFLLNECSQSVSDEQNVVKVEISF